MKLREALSMLAKIRALLEDVPEAEDEPAATGIYSIRLIHEDSPITPWLTCELSYHSPGRVKVTARPIPLSDLKLKPTHLETDCARIRSTRQLGESEVEGIWPPPLKSFGDLLNLSFVTELTHGVEAGEALRSRQRGLA
jgi:hypothetical protein